MPPFEYGFGTQGLVAPPTGPQNNSNGGWLDQVLGQVDDGLSIYNQVRCAIKPTAPGCYASTDQSSSTGTSQPDNTWLFIGLAVIILLVIALVIIAIKK